MPRIPVWIQRKRVIIPISVSLMSMVALVLTQAKEHSLRIQDSAAATSEGTRENISIYNKKSFIFFIIEIV